MGGEPAVLPCECEICRDWKRHDGKDERERAPARNAREHGPGKHTDQHRDRPALYLRPVDNSLPCLRRH